MENVELGDEVKDKVTGFHGVVVGITKHLTGCDRAHVQPPVDKDGKLPEAYMFDLASLKITKKTKVEPKNVQEKGKKGGPPTLAKK